MTLTELQDLSPDEIRVRVAGLMGWTAIKNSDGFLIGVRPNETRTFETLACLSPAKRLPCPSHIPKFITSLDSCREFEDAMTDEECDTYGLWLNTIMVGDSKTDAIREVCDWHASATQKCIAFILTKHTHTKTEGAE